MMLINHGILFGLIALSASTETVRTWNDISSCVFLDAIALVCSWKQSTNHSNLTLYYREGSDAIRNCFRPCKSTKYKLNESTGEMMEFCKIENSVVGKDFFLYVAPSSGCHIMNNNKCWNCSAVDVKEKYYKASMNKVILTVPPTKFHVELNSTLKWDVPKKHLSTLSFVIAYVKVVYRLEYRKADCRNATNFPAKWQIWYEGMKRRYTPPNLIPGCVYQAKISATLLQTGVEKHWGRSSDIEQFVASTLIYPQPTVPVTPAQTTPEPGTHSNIEIGIIIPVLVVLLVVIIFVLYKFAPYKKKVPKPFILLSVEEFGKSDKLYVTEEDKEEPERLLAEQDDDRYGRKEQLINNNTNTEESPVPIQLVNIGSQRRKSGSRSDAKEGCDGEEESSGDQHPGPSLKCSSRSLQCHRTKAIINDSNLASSFPCVFSPSRSGGATKEPGAKQSSGSKLLHELISEPKMNSKQFTPCLAPPDDTRASEYVGYVADPTGPDQWDPGASSFPANEGCRDKNLLLLPTCDGRIPHYVTNAYCPHHGVTPCSYHDVDYNSSGFSSLPSVTSDYILENYSDLMASQSPPCKVAPKLACSHCKKKLYWKRNMDTQKRNSLGGRLEFFGMNDFPVRSKSTDNLSLDSGCSPDLAVSP